MTTATGERIGWSDLPQHVRDGVEEIIGDTVIDARSQPGGFSPGTADRVRTARGLRAFVKAAHPSLNDATPALHRREARNTMALPEGVPAPRLLGTFDDGDWIALVLEDVEGRHPRLPWTSDELTVVLRALKDLARTLTPSPLADLPTVRALLEHDLHGWRRVAADPPADLDPWASANLALLIEKADLGIAALDGDTGVHLDLRADNILVRPDGRVVLVDWPWLSLGPAWLDSTVLMVGVRRFGGHDTHALLERVGREFNVDLETLRGVLIGLAGFFVDGGRKPAIPGLPTVGAWRKAQGDALVAWIIEMYGSAKKP